jgi:hypothetical protein
VDSSSNRTSPTNNSIQAISSEGFAQAEESSAVLEELLALEVGINFAMSHDTAILSATILVNVNDPHRGLHLLLVSLDILLPL